VARQQFLRNNPEGARNAVAAYERALRRDPSYPEAWAGLAEARYWVADTAESSAAIAAGMRAAMDAAERAVAVGPDLADGYLARAFIRAATKFDWPGAHKDLES